MIAGTINNTPKAEDSAKTAEDSAKIKEQICTKEPMWTKENLGTQIRSFEHQISGIVEKVVSYEF